MLKWLLVGWVCTGVGQEQACLRMASEVIHEDLKSCKEYYKVIYNAPNNQIFKEKKFTLINQNRKIKILELVL